MLDLHRPQQQRPPPGRDPAHRSPGSRPGPRSGSPSLVPVPVALHHVPPPSAPIPALANAGARITCCCAGTIRARSNPFDAPSWFIAVPGYQGENSGARCARASHRRSSHPTTHQTTLTPPSAIRRPEQKPYTAHQPPKPRWPRKIHKRTWRRHHRHTTSQPPTTDLTRTQRLTRQMQRQPTTTKHAVSHRPTAGPLQNPTHIRQPDPTPTPPEADVTQITPETILRQRTKL